jgi:hypothetical protein
VFDTARPFSFNPQKPVYFQIVLRMTSHGMVLAKFYEPIQPMMTTDDVPLVLK